MQRIFPRSILPNGNCALVCFTAQTAAGLVQVNVHDFFVPGRSGLEEIVPLPGSEGLVRSWRSGRSRLSRLWHRCRLRRLRLASPAPPAEPAEPAKNRKKCAQNLVFCQKVAPISRPESGQHFNYQQYGWSRFWGPDSGLRSGGAKFSIFRANFRPGPGFLAAPRVLTGLAPERLQVQPRTRLVAAPNHNPSPGPPSHTLRPLFLISRPAYVVIARCLTRALCLLSPLSPES